MSNNFTEFGGGIWIGSLSADPAGGRAGEFYYNTVFKKFRGFDGTIWANVGSGAGGGGINFGVLDSSYLPNNSSDYDFEIGVGTWAAYQNTAQAVPVNMQGGTPMIAVGTTTSSGEILDGQQSLKVAKGPTNQQGSGVSKKFYIPPGWRGINMNLSFLIKAIGGTNFAYGDIAVYGYDVSNGVIITPENNIIVPGSAQLNYNVFIPTNCAEVYFGVHFATNVTYDIQYSMDDVALSPFTNFETPTADDWMPYTPSFQGFGSPSNIAMFSRRVGDSLEVMGNFVSGVPTSVQAQMTLGYKGINGNVQADSSKFIGNQLIGVMGQSGGVAYSFYILSPSSNVNYILFSSQSTSTSANNPANADALVVNGYIVNVFFKIPIAGWSTNLASSGSKHYNMSTILAAGTRVTGTPPVNLGEYRSYLRQAAVNTLTESNADPSDPFDPINGCPIYNGNVDATADAAHKPTAYDIFVGKNKVVQFNFYVGPGKTQPMNVNPFSVSSIELGLVHGYEPSTGIAYLRRPFYGTGSGGHDIGTDATTGEATAGAAGTLFYFDITVADNLFALQLGLKESWSGYIDPAAYWSTSSGSFVDPTLTGTVNFFTRKNSNFGAVAAASSSKPGFTFTPSDPNAVYLITACAVIAEGGTAGAARLWDGTNVIATAGAASASAGGNSTPLIGVYAPGSTAPVEISIQLQVAAGSIVVGNQTAALFNSVEFTVTRIA